MFCSNCGARISDDAAFCSNCGAPVERDIDQVSFKAAADNQVNNKKPVIIGACCSVAVLAVCLLCVALLTRTLSADHSDTSVAASGDSDSIEEEGANVNDDNNGEEAAANDDTIVVSDEAYIERLEAYQEYYNSVKDEDENYEVLAAISLDEDNLPIMWIAFVDKDELQRSDSDNLLKYYYGFCDCVQVYGYEKKAVTMLAETSRLSDDLFAIAPTNRYLCLNLGDGEDYIYYDKSIDGFTEPAYDSDLCTWLEDTYITGVTMGDEEAIEEAIGSGELVSFVYCGYSYEVEGSYDVKEYWWDGTLVTAEREKEYAIFVLAGLGDIPVIFFEDSSDFNIRIENLIEEPTYDIIMLALKSECDKICNISYIDLDNKDNIDELFEYLVNRRVNHLCKDFGYSYEEAIEDINQSYGLNLE